MTFAQNRDNVVAPELTGAIAWLNVRGPLSIRDLRGSVVILDFWTYCCINCMHVVPTLRELERRYTGEPLAVIGVHSGKFTAERDPDRIREAVARYGVEHPVAVDDEMAIWGRYGIRSWPTLVVVGPDGHIAAVAPGEPDLETLDAFVAKLLDEGREAGVVSEGPPAIELSAVSNREPLSYPGKAIALPDGRLAISDSGHHRVLLCSADGVVERAFGSGLRGRADGPAESAAFDDPQGLCWHDGAIYVADARSHAIRRLDPTAGTVTTVAGTGVLGEVAPAGPVEATHVALRSPWDLCSAGRFIYVAMAGSHQLWRLCPAEALIELYAGTGVEALIDGSVASSAWAQPSGLAVKGTTLYVADSETSAIRSVDLEQGTVRTIAGLGLFDFGDAEGGADVALLQHPLDVAVDEVGVLIADTYNGKIKRWTPPRAGAAGPGEIRTVATGLREPGSVAVAPDGTIIVADTNAHRVVRIRGGSAEPVDVREAPRALVGALPAPQRGAPPKEGVNGWFTTILGLPASAGLATGDATVELSLRSPEGFELSPGTPVAVSLEVSRRSDLLMLRRASFEVTSDGGPSQQLRLDVHALQPGASQVDAEILAKIAFITCGKEDATVCTPGRLHLRIPVRLLEGGGTRELAFDVELPRPVQA